MNEYPWMVVFASKAADNQGGCGATLVCITINIIPVAGYIIWIYVAGYTFLYHYQYLHHSQGDIDFTIGNAHSLSISREGLILTLSILRDG